MLTLYPAVLLFLGQGWTTSPLRAPLAGVDVPLAPLPGDSSLGFTLGASFLDYDADGWVDLYMNDLLLGGQLRRNVDGLAFPFVANPDVFLPQLPPIRYGAACADYDDDGLPDIALETRYGCFYLLKNLDGAGNFREVGSDPEIVLDPPSCSLACETFCWADVDEDGDLDLFAPAYPDSEVAGSGGNHFFENLGPSGPGSGYRLARRTAQSGLEIPVGAARPEGAQFADVDRDGDLDLYSNGTLYQNVTAGAGPRFRALAEDATGITRAAVRDEGALFFDFDMDGDWDLLVVHYEASSDDLYENRGDGTFRRTCSRGT